MNNWKYCEFTDSFVALCIECSSRYLKADHRQRIVLVGYSFGQLVIKSLVVEAKKTTQAVLPITF